MQAGRQVDGLAGKQAGWQTDRLAGRQIWQWPEVSDFVPKTCENCTKIACISRMSVGFLSAKRVT